MGTCASSCFSQNNKVAPLQIDESKFIFAVQATKSETVKTGGKQSRASSGSSLRVANNQAQPKRTSSPIKNDKKEVKIISGDLAEKKSNSSLLNTEPDSGESFLKDSSECDKDQSSFGIARPANPTPRGSVAFLDAVLPGNAAVDDNGSTVSTWVPNSGSCLSRTSVTSQDVSKTARQTENTFTVESQANDLQSLVAVSSRSVCPEKPSLQEAKLPNPWSDDACSTSIGRCSGVKLDHLLLCQASELPRLKSRTRRPMHGKSSTRVPVFTDPLIVGHSDGSDDDFITDTKEDQQTVGEDSRDGQRCRKLRPLHGKSSGRVPVFADPLLLRDCDEDYEKEICDMTKSQPMGVGHSRALVDQVIVGSVNNNTDGVVTCDVASGRLKLAPLEKRKKPRPLYGRSSGRVAVFTDPLITGKDKPVRLNKIPHPPNTRNNRTSHNGELITGEDKPVRLNKVLHPPSKRNNSTSHNWKQELDRVLLSNNGSQGGALLAENGPSERLLTGESQPSNRVLLDHINRGSKGFKVRKDTDPQLAALGNLDAHDPTLVSFPEIALSSTSGKSSHRLQVWPTPIEQQALKSEGEKFSVVRLNLMSTSTWSSPGGHTVEDVGHKLVLPVLRDSHVNHRAKSSLYQGGSDRSKMDARVGSTHSEVERRLTENFKHSGGGRGSR